MEIEVIGVPTSAGAHHAGQDLAPAALREHGLLDRLRAGGLVVHDAGDVAGERFRRDPSNGVPRNLDAVVRVAALVAGEVERVLTAGRFALVLGGDCTIELGVVAGAQRALGDLRLAYLDGDADLASPGHPGSGIADASGIAHLLGIADDALARLGSRFPLLDDRHLAMLGYDPDDVDAVDAAALQARPGLLHVDHRSLAAHPNGAVLRVREAFGAAPVVVHFDVDAVDSAELPLANFPHYGTGVPLATAMEVLEGLLALPGARALTLTEVNPTYDPNGAELDRYVHAVADAVLEALAPEGDDAHPR
ncbi:arginase family protein [Amnibacterium kyonggiense]|uniref:Arginase n=1 Tax=Amnibacterium kyonggiense TaxID=595671 RepID=A0A4R7FT18_9MICO|nr:arginase family protein [Amnibacterium kyonggiense]TDS80839.1 arginase [Amnibacterium kyonggiense]